MKGATFGRGFVRRNRHYDRQGDGNTNATLKGSIHDDPLIDANSAYSCSGLFHNSDSLAKFTAIRRASLRVRSLAERLLGAYAGGYRGQPAISHRRQPARRDCIHGAYGGRGKAAVVTPSAASLFERFDLNQCAACGPDVWFRRVSACTGRIS